MRFVAVLGAAVVLAAIGGIAVAASRPDYKSLYEAHRWLDLRDAVFSGNHAPQFYQGAVAAAFNDANKAKNMLQAVSQSKPLSADSYEAQTLLQHLLFDSGQYQSFRVALREKARAFPERSAGDLREYGSFMNLPDQILVKSPPSTLHHNGGLWVPLTINGARATYFIDTGAIASAMSESEAKRFGMTVQSRDGTVGTSTGARVGFRLATAGELSLGGFRFQNVTFMIFPDDQQPWSVLPQGRRGLIGIPILLALGKVRWTKNGTLEIGGASDGRDPAGPNLYFDDDHLVAGIGFSGRRIPVTLDTGAETTDIYRPFASEFSVLLDKIGQRRSHAVEGISNTKEFESIEVPQLDFSVGGLSVTLRPANVLLSQVGPAWSCGNLGLDLLREADEFTVDFRVMRLDLFRGSPRAIRR